MRKPCCAACWIPCDAINETSGVTAVLIVAPIRQHETHNRIRVLKVGISKKRGGDQPPAPPSSRPCQPRNRQRLETQRHHLPSSPATRTIVIIDQNPGSGVPEFITRPSSLLSVFSLFPSSAGVSRTNVRYSANYDKLKRRYRDRTGQQDHLPNSPANSWVTTHKSIVTATVHASAGPLMYIAAIKTCITIDQ